MQCTGTMAECEVSDLLRLLNKGRWLCVLNAGYKKEALEKCKEANETYKKEYDSTVICDTLPRLQIAKIKQAW